MLAANFEVGRGSEQTLFACQTFGANFELRQVCDRCEVAADRLSDRRLRRWRRVPAGQSRRGAAEAFRVDPRRHQEEVPRRLDQWPQDRRGVTVGAPNGLKHEKKMAPVKGPFFCKT